MELKATKGISLKRSSMGSKKRKKNSFKRQKRRKAADIKYSMTEITRMARNRPVRPKKLKTPDFENGKEELLRLMKRIRPTVEKEKEYLYKEGCAVCSKDHFPEDCPCLDKIPPGTDLGPLFDRVCNCCGKIGDECCRKGAYAILTRCDGCENIGHWYWENRCPKDWCRPSYLVEIPSIQELEHEVMQNKNKVVVQEDDESDSEDEYDYDNFYDDNGCLKRLKTPDFKDDKEELLRLMKRIRPTVEKEKEYLYKEGCAVCSKDHFPEDCPCLDKIPPGTDLGPLFDRVCNCCGKIGDECCRKGAYAILTRCDGCENIGHWYWENRCPKDWCRPSYLVEIPSIQELEHEVMQNKNKVVVQEDEKNSIKEVPSTEQSLENSLQNKEEDDVKVDVGKDNKSKDEVMVEDDDSKEDDEAKGGNESSNQSRSKSCKAILTQSGLSRSKDVKAIEELTAGCYRSLRL
ncbi:PREDICTED: uncharacterized protein LOC101305890 isoform X2 [Fragaria vesca subsp. vesca]|uniref:uncharacterized protein LOC101305890 isoform X2 n=1 Tax=Fragaria vesca subsp. vesca TaxID=101020 RepID=UPI0002C2E9A7|nr:PREDICTED: uncharacterized protein LOC101305890 isoform X2 [Fragaria vesca subsp. vesca]